MIKPWRGACRFRDKQFREVTLTTVSWESGGYNGSRETR